MSSLPILRVLPLSFLSSLGSCICSLQQPRQKETALPCSLCQLRLSSLYMTCRQFAHSGVRLLLYCWSKILYCCRLYRWGWHLLGLHSALLELAHSESPKPSLSPSLRNSLVFGSTFAHTTLSPLESSLYNVQDQNHLQGLDKTSDDGCWTTFSRLFLVVAPLLPGGIPNSVDWLRNATCHPSLPLSSGRAPLACSCWDGCAL